MATVERDKARLKVQRIFSLSMKPRSPTRLARWILPSWGTFPRDSFFCPGKRKLTPIQMARLKLIPLHSSLHVPCLLLIVPSCRRRMINSAQSSPRFHKVVLAHKPDWKRGRTTLQASRWEVLTLGWLPSHTIMYAWQCSEPLHMTKALPHCWNATIQQDFIFHLNSICTFQTRQETSLLQKEGEALARKNGELEANLRKLRAGSQEGEAERVRLLNRLKQQDGILDSERERSEKVAAQQSQKVQILSYVCSQSSFSCTCLEEDGRFHMRINCSLFSKSFKQLSEFQPCCTIHRKGGAQAQPGIKRQKQLNILSLWACIPWTVKSWLWNGVCTQF